VIIKHMLWIVLLCMLGCASSQPAPPKAEQRLVTLKDVEEFSFRTSADPADTAEHGANDQGGVADITDLEQDMRVILVNWNQAAITGVTLFATNELSKQLDSMQSGNWKNYWISLLGNTIWAGTVFMSAGSGSIFGVSMIGIVVAASPSVPSAQQSSLPDVQEQMVNYMQSIYDQLDPQLRTTAARLIANNPGITRYSALNLFVQNSFKPGMYHLDPESRWPPTLNKQAITHLYRTWPATASATPSE
jgi:hypothetical protein